MKKSFLLFCGLLAGLASVPHAVRGGENHHQVPAGIFQPRSGEHRSASAPESAPVAEESSQGEQTINEQFVPPADVAPARDHAPAVASAGLVINPTFDSSITGNGNAAAIEAAINQAITTYEGLVADPVTVSILFRYSNTAPDGSPLVANLIAQSNYVLYDIPWNTYVTGLVADAKTTKDASANVTLPTTPYSDVVASSGAAGRAIGLGTPPSMYADGHVAAGGPYDGIVTLNSAEPIQFTRPPAGTKYDGLSFIEHEMDEVLGLGSFVGSSFAPGNLRPQDLFSWGSPGSRSLSLVGSRYFSINSGNTDIIGFNQDTTGDTGDWLTFGCPNSNPRVQDAFTCKGQASDFTAASPEGVSLDVIGYDVKPLGPTPTPGPTFLANISTRVRVETGDNTLIGGFIVTGTASKKVILRAIGPSLPLSGTLADPVLELHSASRVIATNDNWRSDQETEINATGIAPSNDNESAIVATLDPGPYTAIVSGANGGTGIALVEIYDLDPGAASTLGNISTRGLVQTDDNVLIGGFIVLGGYPTVALVRAIGPSLPVSGALADPTLELHDADGRTIVSNDDWMSNQVDEIMSTGIPPTNDKESTIFAILAPGSYTAIVRGQNNTTGVALVEVYQITQ